LKNTYLLGGSLWASGASRELSGRIAWISARKGTLPAEQRIVVRCWLIDPYNIVDYILIDVLSELQPF
jgi:hypothetical protein